MAYLYGMFLLAQFRETRAYPLVVRFASLPGDLLDSLCGDFITMTSARYWRPCVATSWPAFNHRSRMRTPTTGCVARL